MRLSSDMPIEYASHCPSAEKAGLRPKATVRVVSRRVWWMRSSWLPFTRRMGVAIQVPSGERVAPPRRSHCP